MNTDYDVLISGGGLVGGSLALALQGSGLRVALVEMMTKEQKQTSPAGERVLAISQGSRQVLECAGLWALVTQQSEPIKTIQVSDRGFLGKTRLSAEREKVPALGYVLEARTLDLALVEALSVSDVDVLSPAQLTALDNSAADAVTATLRFQDGAEEQKSARLLVAADGGYSQVRTQLAIHARQIDYDQTALITRVQVQIPVDGIAYERFTESGPLAFLPMGRRNYSVVWTLKPADAQQLLSLSEEEFIQRLQTAFGFRLGRLALVAARHAFPLQLLYSETLISQRVVLVGNAAHQLHPVAGQGFNLGLRDADCLAALLIEQSRVQDDPGSQALLQAYAQARKDDQRNAINFTNGLIWLFSSDWQLLGHARGLGLMALDRLPWLKRRVAQAAMGLRH